MFKPGNKILCIREDGSKLLKQGKIYTIKEVDLSDEGYVILEEFKSIKHNYSFTRFELIRDEGDEFEIGIKNIILNFRKEVK